MASPLRPDTHLYRVRLVSNWLGHFDCHPVARLRSASFHRADLSSQPDIFTTPSLKPLHSPRTTAVSPTLAMGTRVSSGNTPTSSEPFFMVNTALYFSGGKMSQTTLSCRSPVVKSTL